MPDYYCTATPNSLNWAKVTPAHGHCLGACRTIVVKYLFHFSTHKYALPAGNLFDTGPYELQLSPQRLS